MTYGGGFARTKVSEGTVPSSVIVSRVRYDLAVTDPSWLDQLNLLTAGIYPHGFFFKGTNIPRTFLTVSLSEPFKASITSWLPGSASLLA